MNESSSGEAAPPAQSFLAHVTPVLLTFNEEANVYRTLEKLCAFPEVIVLDSGSTDDTLNLVGRFPNVRVLHRNFDTHAAQWSYALTSTNVKTEWVLALDADYVLTDGLLEELTQLTPAADVAGWRAQFRYCVMGRPLRAALYPPVTVLFRRDRAHYVQDGHTQRIVVSGHTADLQESIHHDDRKSLGRWLWAQDRYAQLEVSALAGRRASTLPWPDRLRKLIVITPWLVPLHYLLLRGGLLDGRHGLHYALQRAVAEAILSLHLLHDSFASREERM